MPIRKSLPRTQSATYLVGMLTEKSPEVPEPRGSGFFVGQDGLFLTAHHVLEAGIRPRECIQIPREDSPSMVVVDEVVADDAEADFALLKGRTLGPDAPITYLTPSARVLDEAEPVYAYGFPLSIPGAPFVFKPPSAMAEIIEEHAIDESGEAVKVGPSSEFVLMNHKLSPRVSGAVIASHHEYHNTLDWEGTNDAPTVYVLDQPLNYGISGGPVVATETGEVHALCTRFQPMEVPQDEGRPPVFMPSNYGVVTRLSHPTIREALEQNGVTLSN